MPGISSLKLIVIGLAVIAIGATVFAGYRYIENMQRTIRVLEANNAKLETAVDHQKDTIGALETTVRERDARTAAFERTVTELAEKAQRNRADLDELNSTLAKHDLERLADAKPQLVESRLNRGTRDVIRLLNAAGSSGSLDETRRGGAGAAGATPAPGPAAAR